MPTFEPLSEVQKEFLPVLNNFLARADIQGLHQIVDKQTRDTEKLQGTFEKLQRTVERFRLESEELKMSNAKFSRESDILRATNEQCNEKHSREVEKLQGMIEKLQGTVQKSQGANEELRTSNKELRDANVKLQSISEEAIEKSNAIEKRLDIALDNVLEQVENGTRNANQELSSRVDLLHVDAQSLQNLQEHMRQCDARFADTEFRQQNTEEVVEKMFNMISNPPSSPLGVPPEANQEIWQDPYAQSSHNSRKRHYAPNSDDELADLRHREGFKRHARNRYQENTASRPTESSNQPPQSSRQDAAKAGGSGAQRPKTRDTTARLKKQPEANVSNDTDESSPRFEAIKAHYKSFKAKFDASQPRNHRQFIWEFIEGSGDDEFCTWFQEHLLEALSLDKAKRSSKKPRNRGDRIIALSQSLTWNEVRDVVKGIPRALPHFLE